MKRMGFFTNYTQCQAKEEPSGSFVSNSMDSDFRVDLDRFLISLMLFVAVRLVISQPNQFDLLKWCQVFSSVIVEINKIIHAPVEITF